MTELIIIIGTLILVSGIALVTNPEVLFGYLRNNAEKIELQILAVVVRMLLGALLVYQAGVSRYPVVIEIIGWVSIVAAALLVVIGRQNFIRLVAWALTLVKPFGRTGGFIAAIFGAFLIHAFV